MFQFHEKETRVEWKKTHLGISKVPVAVGQRIRSEGRGQNLVGYEGALPPVLSAQPRLSRWRPRLAGGQTVVVDLGRARPRIEVFVGVIFVQTPLEVFAAGLESLVGERDAERCEGRKIQKSNRFLMNSVHLRVDFKGLTMQEDFLI